MPIAPVQACKADEWDRQIDVDIKGVLYGSLLPCLKCRSRRAVTSSTSLAFFGIKVFAPGGLGLLRHEVCCAHVDGRTADGTTFPKHPLHDDLSGCCCHGAIGEQLGRSDQKEFARVLQNGYSRQLNRERDRLRHRTTN